MVVKQPPDVAYLRISFLNTLRGYWNKAELDIALLGLLLVWKLWCSQMLPPQPPTTALAKHMAADISSVPDARPLCGLGSSRPWGAAVLSIGLGILF